MKYTRLTKEQFEELHKEFINFLATQSITADEWETLKKEKPEVVEQELDIFSDLVWYGVLKKVRYLEHISSQHLHLIKCKDKDMHLIALKVTNKDIDLTTATGFQWLRDHLLSDEVEFYNSKKTYSDDKLLDIFKLIQQGAHITKGELFKYFEKLIGQ